MMPRRSKGSEPRPRETEECKRRRQILQWTILGTSVAILLSGMIALFVRLLLFVFPVS